MSDERPGLHTGLDVRSLQNMPISAYGYDSALHRVASNCHHVMAQSHLWWTKLGQISYAAVALRLADHSARFCEFSHKFGQARIGSYTCTIHGKLPLMLLLVGGAYRTGGAIPALVLRCDIYNCLALVAGRGQRYANSYCSSTTVRDEMLKVPARQSHRREVLRRVRRSARPSLP